MQAAFKKAGSVKNAHSYSQAGPSEHLNKKTQREKHKI